MWPPVQAPASSHHPASGFDVPTTPALDLAVCAVRAVPEETYAAVRAGAVRVRCSTTEGRGCRREGRSIELPVRVSREQEFVVGGAACNFREATS